MKRILAEAIGTMLLVTAVVGSGAMAENLTRDTGVALLLNAVSTVSALWLLILLFSPISGAHFNPLVTLAEYFLKRMTLTDALTYILAQFLGGILGAILANLMFEHPAIFPSHHIRNGVGLFLGEVIATAGLLLIIHMLSLQGRSQFTPIAVAMWIGSAYFFTSSTSFANPAVTLARTLSDTFSGIALSSLTLFLLAQSLGALIGTLSGRYLGKLTKLEKEEIHG